MLDIPEDIEWRRLFEISLRLRKLEPWKNYKNTEIITLETDDAEPCFCSILGSEGDYYGVSLYPGYKSLSGLLKILTLGADPPLNVILENQQCLTVYFGEKDILSPGDLSAMELGDFSPEPGPANNIFFRTYTPGLAPWYINSEESRLLLKNLSILYQGLLLAAEKNLKANPEKSENLYIKATGSQEAEIYLNELPSFDLTEQIPVIKDELFIARLKRQPRITNAMEAEATYLPSPVLDGESLRPCFPQIVALADHDEGIIEDHKILSPEDNVDEEIINLLANYIKSHGRPRVLIIRKQGIYNKIKDLCHKINLRIEERDNLEILDDFLSLIGSGKPVK